MTDPDPNLHTELVKAEGAAPVLWLYLLHGIFGAGRNWAGVARRLARERPEWGSVLVDLREHGSSGGFRGPHTLASCASDVARLVRESGREPSAVLGHSFGGKVALEFVEQGGRPQQLWVVESTPEARPAGESALAMLERLRELPGPFTSRDALIGELRSGGMTLQVAQWMATNLTGDPESGYRWRLELASIEELLEDFGRREYWELLEEPPAGTEIHLIRAEDSTLLSGTALERVEELAGAGRIHLHQVAGGHWVNADNPDALQDLLTGWLPGE